MALTIKNLFAGTLLHSGAGGYPSKYTVATGKSALIKNIILVVKAGSPTVTLTLTTASGTANICTPNYSSFTASGLVIQTEITMGATDYITAIPNASGNDVDAIINGIERDV